MNKIFFGIALLFISVMIISCTASLQEQTATTLPITNTPTLTPSLTPSPTQTQTSTATNTPTPQLPVLPATEIPQSKIITSDNAAQLQEIARLWGNPSSFAVLSSDQSRLITANAEGIYIYDYMTEEMIRRFDNPHIFMKHYSAGNRNGGWPIHIAQRNFLDISASGDKIAFLSEELVITVIDDSDTVLFTLPFEELTGENYYYANVMDFSFLRLSPDGKYLLVQINGMEISAGYDKTYIFDIQQSRPVDIGKLELLGMSLENTYFTNDSKYLAFCCHDVESPWSIISTENWEEIGRIVPEVQKVITAAVSPYSDTLAILGLVNNNVEVELWDISTQKKLKQIKPERPLDIDQYFDMWLQSAKISFANDEALIVWDGYYQYLESSWHAQIIHSDGSLGKVFRSSDPNTELVLQPFRMKSDNKLNLLGIYGSRFISFGRATMYARTAILNFSGAQEEYKIVVKGILSERKEYECQIGIRSGRIDNQFTCSEIPYRLASPAYHKAIIPTPRFQSAEYQLYDTQQDKIIESVPDQINNAVVSVDNRYAAFMSWDDKQQRLYVYDLSEDRVKLIINERFSYEIPEIRLNKQDNTYPRPSLQFSPDSKSIVLAIPYKKDTETGVRLIFIDINNSSEKLMFETPVISLVNPAIEINGKTYLHSDGYRYGWHGWQQTVSTSTLAVSPDKVLVAIGTDDGQLIIINSQTGEIVEQRQAHVENIVGMSFSEDGRLLATLSRSGILKLWGILE